MCLAVKGVIKEIRGETALVSWGGVEWEVCLLLVPQASEGETVLVHAGFGIQVVKEDDGA